MNRFFMKPLFLMLLLVFVAATGFSQLTLVTAPTAYRFSSSADQNLHPGFNARLGYDYRYFQFDLGFSYFMPVTTVLKTYAYEIRPTNPLFPLQTVISNNVIGKSFETSFQMSYYILGQPIRKKGLYGLLGSSLFVYNQQNNLSHYNKDDYAALVLDKAERTYSQITVDLGLGGKISHRNASYFLEGRVSIPTDLEKDYGSPIQTTVYYTVTTGIRWHLITRKSAYQMMAGRKKKSNLK
jgi:hypothetical protein